MSLSNYLKRTRQLTDNFSIFRKQIIDDRWELLIRLIVIFFFFALFLFFVLSLIGIFIEYFPKKIYMVETREGFKLGRIMSENFGTEPNIESRTYLLEPLNTTDKHPKYELINSKDVVKITSPDNLTLIILENKLEKAGILTSIVYDSVFIPVNDNFLELTEKLTELINKTHKSGASSAIELQTPTPYLYDPHSDTSSLYLSGREGKYIVGKLNIGEIRELNKLLLVLKVEEGKEIIIPSECIGFISNPNVSTVFNNVEYTFNRILDTLFSPSENSAISKVFPALVGTALLVVFMSLIGVPAGVITAIFLNFYVKEGKIKSVFRLLIANLAGIPSIVIGMFGLVFFIYLTGGAIDSLFFSSNLPSPTWGTGGLLWASAAMALLTAPVVIVSTENSIKAIPEEIKMAAYSLGGTKWQLIRKVIIPSSAPGILTGFVLSVSRGIGEIAPLMILGVTRFANILPIDGSFPFIHAERKFLHISYLVYDLGMLSNNIRDAIPVVFALIFLIIIMVAVLKIVENKLKNIINNKFKLRQYR